MNAKVKPKSEIGIRDRVIEFKRVNRDDVLPNEHNWRRHPDPQRVVLRGLINEIGIAGAGLAYYSERNHGKLTLVDGHLRREEIPEQLPIIITDLNDVEADKLLASYDPLSAMAETDKVQLDALLREVSTGDAALSQMLSDLATESGLSYGDAGITARASEDQSTALISQYQVLVLCKSEFEQTTLLEILTEQGRECRALIS